MVYYEAKEDCREDVLLSLREGALLLNEVKYLLQYFKETEQYECCQGAIEAMNQYKKELDGIGNKLFEGDNPK